MTVEISKEDDAWTIIHNRPEARNVMDPDSSDALVEVFGEFNTSEGAKVGVFYGPARFSAGAERLWDFENI